MNIQPRRQQGAHDSDVQVQEAAPLADKLRPKTAEEIIGQDHLLDTLASTENIIFWGPPG
jgi:replication-associated recombination protein RarA